MEERRECVGENRVLVRCGLGEAMTKVAFSGPARDEVPVVEVGTAVIVTFFSSIVSGQSWEEQVLEVDADG